MSSASAISQCGRALPGAGRGVGVGPDLAGVRHDAREELAPGADDDVRVGVADRDARVGRVRDPQEDVVEPGLDVGGLGVERP